MTTIQLIEELCCLIERQTALIRSLATELECVQDLSQASREEADALEKLYSEILGAGDTDGT